VERVPETMMLVRSQHGSSRLLLAARTTLLLLPRRAASGGGSKGEPIKRFYKRAGVGAPPSSSTSALEGAATTAVQLDGRQLRTPERTEVVLPSVGAAVAVAAEWEEQEKHIMPHLMPLTRLAMTALDRMDSTRAAEEEELVRCFLGQCFTFPLCPRKLQRGDVGMHRIPLCGGSEWGYPWRFADALPRDRHLVLLGDARQGS
jgi:hypothetical protein